MENLQFQVCSNLKNIKARKIIRFLEKKIIRQIEERSRIWTKLSRIFRLRDTDILKMICSIPVQNLLGHLENTMDNVRILFTKMFAHSEFLSYRSSYHAHAS